MNRETEVGKTVEVLADDRDIFLRCIIIESVLVLWSGRPRKNQNRNLNQIVEINYKKSLRL